MDVRVVFYGGLQRDVGAREQLLTLPRDASTVREVADAIVARHPTLGPQLATVVFTVGDEIVAADHPVGDGDEVGLLPPVSGG